VAALRLRERAGLHRRDVRELRLQVAARGVPYLRQRRIIGVNVEAGTGLVRGGWIGSVWFRTLMRPSPEERARKSEAGLKEVRRSRMVARAGAMARELAGGRRGGGRAGGEGFMRRRRRGGRGFSFERVVARSSLAVSI
jgi:hypothetical protein